MNNYTPYIIKIKDSKEDISNVKNFEWKKLVP